MLVYLFFFDFCDVEVKEQDINNIYNFEIFGDVLDVIDFMKKKVYFIICFMSRYFDLIIRYLILSYL